MEPAGPDTVANVPTNLLPQLAAFLDVVRAGSFTAAARRTSSDKSVLSRRVKVLEEGLGVRLLNRTTRSLHVTAAGRRLVDEASGPLADALAALANAGAPDRLEGALRIASAQSLAQTVLVPALARLREEHPQLHVELVTDVALTPLVEHGYDLGVRVGRMPDSALVARKLAVWRHVLVAAPDWEVRHPEVCGPEALRPHWILWDGVRRAQEWSFRRGDEAIDVRMDRSPLVFNSSALLIESARAGLGVAAMPPFCVERELAEGSLVRVLRDWRVDHELGIFGVTAHRTLLPTPVQVVLGALRAVLAESVPRWETIAG